MSTPPKYWILQPKSATIFQSETRPARALGRVREIFGGFGEYNIIPTVHPWPYAVDQNGQGYPAGTVGVRIAWVPGLDDSTEIGASADFRALIPVPSALPAGYTHRWVRDFQYLPGSTNVAKGQAWFTPGGQSLPPIHAPTNRISHRLRVLNSLHDYWYMPDSRGEDSVSASIGGGASWSGPSAGLRYIQWKGVQAGITCELRCNADGSSSGVLGNTLLATFTGPGDSAVITAGLQFPLGVKRFLQYRVNPAPPSNIQLLAGPRVDLALPWTATGAGGLIAPGGYVAGALDVELPT